MLYYLTKPKKVVTNDNQEINDDLEQGIIDEMLDVALTMNEMLKKNNESIDRIEIKVEKLDDEFILLKRKINDI